jgi:hypothetical protein
MLTRLAEHLFDSSLTRRSVGRVNISAELSAVSSYGGFFALTVGGDTAGWHPVGQSYADGCADLIEATIGRHHTTESRIGASLVHLGHAARLWSPVLACVLGHGVLPNLTDLQRADEGAALRLPEPVGEPVAPSPESLYRVVVLEHMEPLEAGLRVKLAPALLSGNIASALVGAAHALLSARPDLRRPIVDITGSLLGTGRLAGTGTITGPEVQDLHFKRRSCCLFYRLPHGGKCGDCPL